MFHVDDTANEEQDLWKSAFLEQVCAMILALALFAVHLAPPGSPWLRARFPVPRRAGRAIIGTAGLFEKQRERVREATLLARACWGIARTCIASGTVKA